MRTYRVIAVSAMLLATTGKVSADELAAPGYKITRLVAPSEFHGIHGLAFDAQDRLYAGSVSGQCTYRVDRHTGKVEVEIPPPEGLADDLIFLPDGTQVWTSISHGMVRARTGDGPIRVLADKLPGANSLSFRKSDKRLFLAQVFGGDALWEIDVTGAKPPRNILKDLGGLNGFDIGPDGWIYGPLWFKGQVVKINPDTAELKVVAEGLRIPAAANFDSKWNLYVLDAALGTVNKIDIATGAKTVVAQLDPSLDNLAIDSHDRVFVSNMADNGIQEVNVKTGKARQVIKGSLSNPRALAAIDDFIYVADMFAYRRVDARNGKVETLDRVFAADTKIDYPTVIAAGAHVLLVNGSGTIGRYDGKSGKLLDQVHGPRGVSAIVELPDGRVALAMRSGSISTLEATEGATPKPLAEGFQRPAALSTRGDSLYVSDIGAHQIVKVNLTDGAKTVVAPDVHLGLAMAMVTDDNLIVLERGLKRIVEIDVRTGAVTEIATHLPIGWLPETSAPLAVGLTVDTDGAIYFSSDIDNSLYRLTRK